MADVRWHQLDIFGGETLVVQPVGSPRRTGHGRSDVPVLDVPDAPVGSALESGEEAAAEARHRPVVSRCTCDGCPVHGVERPPSVWDDVL